MCLSMYDICEMIDNGIEYLKADERERKKMRLLPRTCRECEILGICRDEDNNWKCRHGCRFIPEEQRYKNAKRKKRK